MKKSSKYIPKETTIRSWELSRRSFVKGSIALALLSQLRLLESCTKDFVENNVLNKKQYKIILIVQNILFPKGDYGPSAKEINAHLYLIWVLSDALVLEEDKKYLKDGIKWVQETAQENFKKDFLTLNTKEQEKLISQTAQTSWGENWLSYIMSFIIEAMVSDPIYQFNNGVGVSWLNHVYGLPRPTKSTKYPEIFKTVAKNG